MKYYIYITVLILFLGCKEESDSSSPIKPTTPSTVLNNTILYQRANGVYTISESGTNEKQLLALTGNSAVGYPNWSPDSRIYFTGNIQGETNAQLYSMKEDGSDVMRITNSANIQYSRLSVSAKNQLLYIKKFADGSSGPGLYTSKPNGTEEMKVMDLSEISLSDASWHPDGSKIIYVSDEAKNANNEKVSNIFLVNLDGTNKIQITQNINKDKLYDHPYICPDGSLVVYTATPDINIFGYNVYVSRISGSNENLILNATSKAESWVSRNWTKNVQWILLADHQNNLHMIDPDGFSVKQINQVGSFDAKLKDF
jgi:Tol biopolymer transport system component